MLRSHTSGGGRILGVWKLGGQILGVWKMWVSGKCGALIAHLRFDERDVETEHGSILRH